MHKKFYKLIQKIINGFILLIFLSGQVFLPSMTDAQEIFLPAPGTMVNLSPAFNPPILKGLKVHPENPFLFDFILDNGQVKNATPEDASKLVKYFLASLTTPEKEMWVNLSPYEKDRIVPESFGRTEMGRDLLAQDYILKQITASLIYPEDELGKKFWERIRTEAQKRFGTSDIPVNTFNKVWIIPEKAVVYENPRSASAYVVESSLKVMLEDDYEALARSAESLSSAKGLASDRPRPDGRGTPSDVASSIVREIVIPELTVEVNSGNNFAQLRQIYNSLILAEWYKRKIKNSLLSQVYVDQNKVAGVDIEDPNEKQKIYEQYLEAFKKGAYNYIKEEIDPVSQEMIPKKYFSGGTALDLTETFTATTDARKLASSAADGDSVVRVQVASASVEGLPSIEENDVVFSGPGFESTISGGRSRWNELKVEIGEAKDWPQKIKMIKAGDQEFGLVKKINRGRLVFTLPREEFIKFVELRGWMILGDLPQVDRESDAVFSSPGFDILVAGGGWIWREFKNEVGEASEWPEKTKVLKVGDRDFALVKKTTKGRTVFTLSQSDFYELAQLKGWRLLTDVPLVDPAQDVIFSAPGFNDIVISGENHWAKFRDEVGDAKEWPKKTKVIKVDGRDFVLFRKRNGPAIVFTLTRPEFSELARLKGWKFTQSLSQLDPNRDVSFSMHGFDKLLTNGQKIWRQFKQEVGDAKDWPDKTKVLKVGDRNFILVKKISGIHSVFTLSKEEFSELARIKGWKFSEDLPQVAPDRDVVFSITGFRSTLSGAAAIWSKFRDEVGDAKDWPEKTKTITVGNRKFILNKKMNGSSQSFTLPSDEFAQLAELKGWKFSPDLLQIDKNQDVAFSPRGFNTALVSGEQLWRKFKKEVGEAKEWSEQTKVLRAGDREFVLVKKMHGPQQVFTLPATEFVQFAKLNDWNVRELIEDLIVREGLEKVVSDLGRDPKMLLSYLFLTTNLDPDMIHRIVRRTFEGLRGLGEEEINFSQFKPTVGTVELADVPAETDQPSILLEGWVEGDFTAIQVQGDRSRVIWVREDGTFRSRIILAAGEELNLRLFPFNDENNTFGDSVSVHVQQTSEPKDVETMIADLLQTKGELVERISKDKHRLAYLRKRLEVGLLNHFTEDEAAGFAYLDAQIEGLDRNSVTRMLYEAIRDRFWEIASIDQEGAEDFYIEGLNPNQRLFFYQKYTIFEALQAIRDYEESKDKSNDGNGVNHMPAKVIALEQGLGKTVIALAIARSNEEDGALVVAPNSVVSAWGEQEGHFFTEQRAVAIKGSSKEKTQQLEETEDGSLRVINIEYLRSTETDRLDALNKNPNQIVVLDESQAFSREGSLQSQTAGQIESKYTLLISATPFSSTQTARALLRFITKQAGYEDSKIFSQYFLSDPDALRLLHFLIDQYVIRIKKTDVFKIYDRNLPLEQQNNRLPAKTYIEPEELGAYEMSAEQAESILELFFRWNEWQERKALLTKDKKATYTQDDQERGKSEGEMYFSKMHALRQLMNDPRYVGIDAPSPKHAKMDEIIDKEVVQGKGKVVIFASYKEQVKAYMERYAQHGAVSYYGDTLNDQINSRGNLVDKITREELKFRKINKFEYAIDENGHLIPDAKGDAITPLDYNRYRFQFDPEVKIIISTYDVGAVGVTFTAADAAIFDDLARDYTVMYQAEDRANRIDNLRKKYENRYYRLEAHYPEAFVEGLKRKYAIYTAKGVEIVSDGDAKLDEAQKKEQKIIDLYELFSRGTYDQIQGHNIMVNQKKIFDLVLDGIESEEDLLKQGEDSMRSAIPMLFTNGQEDPKKASSSLELGVDNASTNTASAPGGIDLNASQLDLQTLTSGEEIKFEMTPELLLEFQNAPGFMPIIINIQPMINLQMFLGLKKDEPMTVAAGPS